MMSVKHRHTALRTRKRSLWREESVAETPPQPQNVISGLHINNYSLNDYENKSLKNSKVLVLKIITYLNF